jgi:hypothetical protein
MEGTAEWGALTVLDRLSASGISARIGAARAVASRYLAQHRRFSVIEIRRPGDFRRWQSLPGDLIAYQVSYALAEQLVIRHGVPAVLTYFRAYRHARDHATNFQQAFGYSPEEFIAAVRSVSSVPRLTS